MQQTKVSYLHPLRRLAKDQRKADITEKLNVAKKRLALTVQNSAIRRGKLKKSDAEVIDLEAKRMNALNFLAKEVHDIEAELAKIEKNKTLNSLRKAQKRWETTQKFLAAKKRLELAKQDSGVAFKQQKLQDEYKNKKHATDVKMQNLEKIIAKRKADDSLEARRAATDALGTAVKALVRRRIIASQ